MYHPSRATAGALAGASMIALLAAGCSAGGGEAPAAAQDAVTQEQIDEALSTPTELTFWTWVPDIDKEIALFEEQYPEIDVTVENVGQGLEHYQKVRTALQSGEGAPDVVQIEYQYLSSFTLTDSLLDLAPYGAADLSGEYVDWAWNQVADGESVWAIPQDTGAMGNLYRKDILDAAGVTEPPATYEEYAEAAKKVKDETGSYISNLASNDPAQVVGLLWQAGVKPFGYDGDKTVTIDVNSPEAKEVLAYWQQLIQDDLVSTDADFNDAYYQGIVSDKYAGWLTAAWAPIFLQGTAADTSGKWAAAPLPQWEEGEQVSGNWGGSSDAVLSSTENPIAAYELAKWINNDPSSTTMFANEQFLFPAAKNVLESPEFTGQEVEFFGGQKVNELFAEISGTVDTEFPWLPFTEYAYSSFNEIVGTAIGEKGDLGAALDAWQEDLVTYAESQGFTVQQ
ncbi:extracellular solute-binding protein [Promicromonospora soli]|uniref:Sugar ABC transporter substrate-binding protein n=1 Tax=Promicromonospora soli TaxID=2035533 RepID=A0A919KWN2_9MICO|nr:extracellular solute-binding protein [Promicromonospora soli]GHH75118.1 sugar ABC transporter substrate-binding protein [Promicromonospora soli]